MPTDLEGNITCGGHGNKCMENFRGEGTVKNVGIALVPVLYRCTSSKTKVLNL